MRPAPSKPLWRQVFGLVAWLVVCFAAAGVGGVGSRSAPDFYARLDKPTWAPPASVFGPVWTILYLLMAVAAWLVWREHGWRGARTGLSWFVAQLTLNALWPWTFFAWHLGGVSFVVIVSLFIVIVGTVGEFLNVNRLAAVLLFPYILWVGFAMGLNRSLWQLNSEWL